MWGRKSRQDGVGFYQPGSGHKQLLAATQALFDLADCTLVVLMPTAYSGDHATGVREEACHGRLSFSGSFLCKRPTSLFHDLGREVLNARLRNRDQELAPTHQLHCQNPRLDLDATVVPAHVQGHAGSKPRLPADFTRDDHSPGRIDGSFHTMQYTMNSGSSQDSKGRRHHGTNTLSWTTSEGGTWIRA